MFKRHEGVRTYVRTYSQPAEAPDLRANVSLLAKQLAGVTVDEIWSSRAVFTSACFQPLALKSH